MLQTSRWFKDIAALLLLVDLGLMFSTLIFNNIAAIWVFALFQIVVTFYAITVLYLAYRVARIIPASIPLQRPLGVAFYISAHLLQFAFPEQLPIALTGYLLIALPISMLFLFGE